MKTTVEKSQEITTHSDLADRIADAIFSARDLRRAQGLTFYREHMSAVIRPMLPVEQDGNAPVGPGITAEDIYNAFPRKVGKEAAVKAISKALQRLASKGTVDGVASFLLSKTELFALAVAKWPAEDRQFCPHPATWFNQGRYADDMKEWQRKQPLVSQPSNYTSIR